MVTSVVTVPDGQEEVKPAGRKRRQDASCVDLRGCHHGARWVHNPRRTSGHRQPDGDRQSQRAVHAARSPTSSLASSAAVMDETLTINITIAGGRDHS